MFEVLHISLNIAHSLHSGCRPSNFKLSFTHSPQVFLPLPLPPAPPPSHFYRHSIMPRCPKHLILPCLTTSATLWIPKRLYKSFASLCTLQRRISSIETSIVGTTIVCNIPCSAVSFNVKEIIFDIKCSVHRCFLMEFLVCLYGIGNSKS